MFKAFAIGATLVASLAVTAAPATAAPAPPRDHKMIVDVVSANGSGCPRDTAEVTPSPDGTAFTVTYSQFTAQVGAGTRPVDFRKNCQLGVNVHVPQGYTYAVAGTDYRGYASLAPGAFASQTSFYYFQGERRTTRIRHNFSGPMDANWQRTDTVGVSSLSFLPCGEERYLNINTELRVNAGWSNSRRTTSLLTMDSTDGHIDTIYHVAWKKC
ncbi:DUF4360 domain-containing protein [Amorphoplanes nipponensis]|uniref:DUF4360 domain-containing protein n=1 Tax=Actinoplanes nipponensis TaxID=135950 RepID=A0A919MLJ7_9ACTN|nr:DUF4360 domain-containing protein [Actinoplanes nipponensis]GIE49581.1 hypothetical protein Ani05nite_31150 [Actinoplanes nipponensis]